MPEFSPAVLVALGVTLAAGLSTVLGAAFVVRADQARPRLLPLALAFAGGAMVYVSLVEILPKAALSLSDAHGDRGGYALATLAFFAGVALLVLLDRLVPNPHPDTHPHSDAEREHLARLSLLTAAAITAHNLPEGLATFFATLESPTLGAPLAVAIALHNIPEGVSIAVPVFYATGSRGKAVGAALLSGLAEPLGALLGYLVLGPFLSPSLFGVVFGVIAGAMVYLALDELLPAAQRHAKGHDTAYAMVAGMAMLAASLVLFR
ncbi:zinc transporter ZupT [Roseococcus sp. SDR]|jgi:ZIP family zinc transporter|uniref:zinc transporter ZupT n=1 Tax=Roseococcus sp. SDR TaxID=2835532 RepID=UPI001BCD802E|nr:zinc transporter ZupT [Roseococcus sp. SDR]MBS7789421.1 zinc transporter ZupT [Roseococcus sp. SDR]MBV1844735.1 zinc transporter ZupT [Roseococcus sp. SDR]